MRSTCRVGDICYCTLVIISYLILIYYSSWSSFATFAYGFDPRCLPPVTFRLESSQYWSLSDVPGIFIKYYNKIWIISNVALDQNYYFSPRHWCSWLRRKSNKYQQVAPESISGYARISIRERVSIDGPQLFWFERARCMFFFPGSCWAVTCLTFTWPSWVSRRCRPTHQEKKRVSAQSRWSIGSVLAIRYCRLKEF
jgi:hypothetical protein